MSKEKLEIEQLKKELECINFVSSASNIASINRLKELTKKNKSSYEYCLAVVRLAEYYVNNGAIEKANPWVIDGIRIAEEHNYKDLLNYAYMAMAFTLNDMMDDTNGLEYYLKGLDLSRATKNTYREALYLNNIGDLFMQSEQYALAKPYIEKAIMRWEKTKGLKSTNAYIVMMMNLVEIYLALGNCEEAENLISKTQELIEENMESYILAMSEMFKLAYVRKDYEKLEEVGHRLVDKLNQSDSILTNLPIAEDCAEVSILANNKRLAERFMNYLYKYDQKTACTTHSISFAYLLVKMFEQFNMVDKLAYGYKRYVEVDIQLHNINDENKAVSYVNRLHFHQMLKKQDKLTKKNQLLKDLSDLDELTKTANRRVFNKHFQVELKNSIREGKSIGLIYFDVDYFKEYNDTYGHVAGDKVLKSVAQVLNSEADMYVARVGGDEFVACGCGMSDEKFEEVIIRCKERLRDLHIEHIASKVSPFVTFTCGYFNTIPDASVTKTDIIKKADSALYKAKMSGRDAWCAYKEEKKDE